VATWLDFATPGVKGAYFPIIRSRRAYNPFEEDVFTCGLIYLFICSIRLQLGNLDGSKAAFDHAAEVVRKQRPQFLIPDVKRFSRSGKRMKTMQIGQEAWHVFTIVESPATTLHTTN
jgi:hypothetical protein